MLPLQILSSGLNEVKFGETNALAKKPTLLSTHYLLLLPALVFLSYFSENQRQLPETFIFAARVGMLLSL